MFIPKVKVELINPEDNIRFIRNFLEKENTALRTEVAELRKEVGKCKTIVSKYETKYGPL